jgi:1-deoxy-D-xylulose-5-phosphate reductoisomerase
MTVLHATPPAQAHSAEPKTVSIFGSTGSVGCNTVNLILEKPNLFQIEVLTANKNAPKLAEQARALDAKRVVIADESQYQSLKELLAGSNVDVCAGEKALLEAAALPVDWTMSAIVGAAGLAPTLAAIRGGNTVALANKEALVCAGDLMMRNVSQNRSVLLPVDSEHNAIFQVLDTRQIDAVTKITLTASGGPFRSRSREDMAHVTRAQALAHPNWDMGAKISVDSATMMNKGLELIEAYHLFPVTKKQIDILVHPQSVIHSMVTYADGSVLAQLGTPDMRTPISYALGWPDRHAFKADTLDLAQIGQLTFEKPDADKFPALNLARAALDQGQSAPAILNAANEVAVEAFLQDRVGFLEIATIVDKVMNQLTFEELTSIDQVFEVDREARVCANALLDQIS